MCSSDLFTISKLNVERRLVSQGEEIIQLVYSHDNREALNSKAGRLEKLVTPEVWATLDNRYENIYSRRFKKETWTQAFVIDAKVETGKEPITWLIIGFNPECELEDRLVKLSRDKYGVVNSYEEYIFKDPFKPN